ncbi:MAG TPA: DUF1819 family protein [Synergistales bacterium]|nr:DUF1819 family protein [Synergistales bacterium]
MDSTYKFSFTAGSLLLNETLKVAEVYLQTRDWNETASRVFSDNILQRNTVSSQKRVFQEVQRRLKTLRDEEIAFLLQAPLEDQKQMIFLSICRFYGFIRDFVLHVLRQNFLSMKTILWDADYFRFAEGITLEHQEYENLSEKTKKKVHQVLLRLLVEVGLLTSIHEGSILPLIVSTDLQHLIANNDPAELALFLYTDQQIKDVVNRYGQ